jgi:nucleoside-diphosphate-sugar epimerase
MKILLTGASGFLGSALQERFGLEKLETISLGRSDNNDIKLDLASSAEVVLPRVEMVVHAAGKAHIVPKTEKDKQDFYKVNVEGTKHLLQALEGNTELKKIVFVSSVAVYGKEYGTAINEESPLLAKDPYGESKLKAEELVASWCRVHGVSYFIFRLPLIAGPNAPGNLGAMVKAIKNNRYLKIGDASAKKSMVLAADVAKLISTIDGPSGFYNLTDGYHPSFEELENRIASHFNKKRPLKVPILLAKCIAIFGDIVGAKFPINSNKLKKITSTLTFNDSKARANINWQPSEVLKKWSIE